MKIIHILYFGIVSIPVAIIVLVLATTAWFVADQLKKAKGISKHTKAAIYLNLGRIANTNTAATFSIASFRDAFNNKSDKEIKELVSMIQDQIADNEVAAKQLYGEAFHFFYNFRWK